ncbi:hypothetical protein NQZ68_016198 [Dissostichus eleginoides]|nr:hypothetical protein NQZ68_016198 [Dissostichus eleginoides]
MTEDGLHPASLFQTKESNREWHVCANSEAQYPPSPGGFGETNAVPRGAGPATRQPSSKLSSHPINPTNEQSVCEKTPAGDGLHLGQIIAVQDNGEHLDDAQGYSSILSRLSSENLQSEFVIGSWVWVEKHLQHHLPPSSTTPLEPKSGPFIKEAHTSLHIGPNFDSYRDAGMLGMGLVFGRGERSVSASAVVGECDINLYQLDKEGPPADL